MLLSRSLTGNAGVRGS